MYWSTGGQIKSMESIAEGCHSRYPPDVPGRDRVRFSCIFHITLTTLSFVVGHIGCSCVAAASRDRERYLE